MKRIWEIVVTGDTVKAKRTFYTEAETDEEAVKLVRVNYPVPKGAKIAVSETIPSPPKSRK